MLGEEALPTDRDAVGQPPARIARVVERWVVVRGAVPVPAPSSGWWAVPHPGSALAMWYPAVMLYPATAPRGARARVCVGACVCARPARAPGAGLWCAPHTTTATPSYLSAKAGSVLWCLCIAHVMAERRQMVAPFWMRCVHCVALRRPCDATVS